jgi:hypothetical protein
MYDCFCSLYAHGESAPGRHPRGLSRKHGQNRVIQTIFAGKRCAALIFFGMFNSKVCIVAAALLLAPLMGTTAAAAQLSASPIEPNGTARVPNTNGVYAALRSSLPVGEGVTVKDFTLEREGGSFHFEQGSFFLYAAVNGHVTGAVFLGKGHFALSPKDASEQHSLGLLTKSGVMAQDFSSLLLRFTDGTAEEIRKASAGSAGPVTGPATSAAADGARAFRQKLHENFELRLLDDALEAAQGQEPGRFFAASFRMGGLFTGRNVLFVVDPQGALNAAPEEVGLSTWGSDEGSQTWAAYPMQHRGPGAGVGAHVPAQKLDVSFEKSGTIHASAESTVTMLHDGIRVVHLNLYPTLRVSGVYSEKGAPLDFVQEAKEYDPAFAVVLPEAAKRGETTRLLIRYSGPDALRRDGDNTYYLLPSARERWYPSGQEGLGGYADFRMTFHVPKYLELVATGNEISRETEPGGGTRVVWQTQAPIPVAGFNIGEFKKEVTKVTTPSSPKGFEVSAYANVNLPDYVVGFSHGMLGTLSTVGALKNELAQGSAAIQVYSDFFGKLPYDHVALTQQSACNFGQSWPMLVYLPICAFWDTTVQHAFGLLEYDASYWREVTPHEVSHQWWGQTVGFSSYRDQWMSEGFANFSVGIYLLQTSPKMDQYRDFWNEQHRNLVQKNKEGVRPIDVGSLTMGARVSNEKTGNVYQSLIYSKGAYVMHMLEMMYWTPQQKEEPFRKSMQAFVAEYAGKAATTENLKTSFEHTLPKWVDVKGDGKLDWFFDEYVYGTELPHYSIASDFTAPDGETSVHFKLSQSGVSKNFLMLVPIYLQMENGATVRIANMRMSGEETIERTYKLGKLPSPGKKLLLNYNADVLSD